MDCNPNVRREKQLSIIIHIIVRIEFENIFNRPKIREYIFEFINFYSVTDLYLYLLYNNILSKKLNNMN